MANFIKEYWENQGRQHGQSHWASWGDAYMIHLEIEAIGAQIKDDMTVLDVGCANGYSSIEQLKNKNLKQLIGIDYAENMITEANKAKESLGVLKNKVFFKQGDILSLDFADESFDVTYTTRVLINLSTWEQQIQGIKECLRVTKKGGVIVFSEAFWEPLCQLNALRSVAGLALLAEHDFNRYLKKQKLEALLNELNVSFDRNNFSSLYYLGSRFLRDLVSPQPKGFENSFNEVFYTLEQTYVIEQFGVQQAYIIKKS